MKCTKTLCALLLYIPLGTIVYAQTDPASLDVSQLHMITYKRTISHHYNSWSIQYREFRKESKQFQIPVAIGFGRTEVDQGFLNSKNVINAQNYALSLGFDGYEFMGQGFYFNLGVSLSTGLETVNMIDESRKSRFLIAGVLSTGLLYVPFPDYGFVIGLNILGSLSSSQILNHSIGFGIEAGLNF